MRERPDDDVMAVEASDWLTGTFELIGGRFVITLKTEINNLGNSEINQKRFGLIQLQIAYNVIIIIIKLCLKKECNFQLKHKCHHLMHCTRL